MSVCLFIKKIVIFIYFYIFYKIIFIKNNRIIILYITNIIMYI